MRYGQIRKLDVANGPGIRVSFFVTGCNFNCLNCFNKDYQDFNYGDIWTDKETQELIKALKNPHIKGLSILGGEPFEHTFRLKEILEEIRGEMREDQDIWIWSGYTFENIKESIDKRRLVSLCDVLVDGPFVEAKKDLTLKFRGSSNQRLINLKETFDQGRIVLIEE